MWALASRQGPSADGRYLSKTAEEISLVRFESPACRIECEGWALAHGVVELEAIGLPRSEA